MSLASLPLEKLTKVADVDKRETIYIDLLNYEKQLRNLNKNTREDSLQTNLNPLLSLIKKYGNFIAYPTRKLLSNCIIALLKGRM